MARRAPDVRLDKRQKPPSSLPQMEEDGTPPAPSFKELFSVQRLKRTWNVLRREIREIVARDVVDWMDWSLSIEQALQHISSEVIAGTYVPQPPTRFEAPKSKGAYRVIASLNMRDALVYRHISDEALRRYLPEKVEGAFYSRKHSATPVGKTFTFEGDSSHRFFEVWLRYNEYRTRTMLNEPYTVLVTTDISNYFESVQHELLLEYLAPLGLPREATGLLGRLLEMLKPAIGHSPTPRVGLPVDELDCSRQLGHIFLFEHDRRVVALVGEANYARWMDDQNIGARNETHARKIVNELTRSLYYQRLTLNSGKTRFLSPEEVITHFQLDANEQLNAFQEKLPKTGRPAKSFIKEFEVLWLELSNSNAAGVGNWDKILKRAYSLATKLDSSILETRVYSDLVQSPELVDRIVPYLSRRNRVDELLDLFSRYMASGENIFESIEFFLFEGFLDLNPPAKSAGELASVAEKFAKCKLDGQTRRPLGRAAAVMLLYWLGYPSSDFARLFSRLEARSLPKEVARAWLACGFGLGVEADIRAALMAHSAEDVGRLAYFLDDIVSGRLETLPNYKKLRSRWPATGEYYDVRSWIQFDVASRASHPSLAKRIRLDAETFAKHARTRAEKRVLERVNGRTPVRAPVPKVPKASPRAKEHIDRFLATTEA